jgi:prephenate dehydratase
MVGARSGNRSALAFISRYASFTKDTLCKGTDQAMARVAIQGLPGSNSDLAAKQHFGLDVQMLAENTIQDMIAALSSGSADYALLAVENSFAGSVQGAYETLLETDFRIQAEVILRVHHALLALPGQTIEGLGRVRSHPQALAQCIRFLDRYHLKPESWYDTAGAAKDLAGSDLLDVGVVASTQAAQLYGLAVIAERIEDTPFNFTRFFVLGHEAPGFGEYNKTSVVFATRHRPAALYSCLGEFAQRGINLTKIESRPRQNRPWEPIFFVDFEGHWQDESCQNALNGLLQHASFVKMLGSYPAQKTI